MPVFLLPGLGAYVRWTALGVSARTRAFVSPWRAPWPVVWARRCAPCCGCKPATPYGSVWPACRRCSNVLNLIPIWGTGWRTGDRRTQQDRTHHAVQPRRFSLQQALVNPCFLLVAGRRGLSAFHQGHSDSAKPCRDGLLLAGSSSAGFPHRAGTDAFGSFVKQIRYPDKFPEGETRVRSQSSFDTCGIAICGFRLCYALNAPHQPCGSG